MSDHNSIPPEQRELEVLRRLADHVRGTFRDGAGVFSLRTHRIEKWDETELPALLKTLDAVQGAKLSFGRNWEVCPEDDEGVFLLDGHRVKIVPVEPTERMVHDDNANDPPMSHPFGSLNSDAIRYIYKQLLRVSPRFDLPAQSEVQVSPASEAPTVEGPAQVPAQAGAQVSGMPQRSARLQTAIEEAEHKPGTWKKAMTQFGAIASSEQDLTKLAEGQQEQIIGSFGYKRDGWLATAAVNALPSLLEIAHLAKAVVENGESAESASPDTSAQREALRAQLVDRLTRFEAS